MYLPKLTNPKPDCFVIFLAYRQLDLTSLLHPEETPIWWVVKTSITHYEYNQILYGRHVFGHDITCRRLRFRRQQKHYRRLFEHLQLIRFSITASTCLFLATLHIMLLDIYTSTSTETWKMTKLSNICIWIVDRVSVDLITLKFH